MDFTKTIEMKRKRGGHISSINDEITAENQEISDHL
jgi:hypothetical protein